MTEVALMIYITDNSVSSQCVQVLMLATEPSVSLSAANVQTGAPEFGTVDLTEDHIVLRPFPRDAEERALYRYLLEQMRGSPDRRTKAEFRKTCLRRFHVTVGSFNYCWREVNKVTGTGWDHPGRRSRQNFSR